MIDQDQTTDHETVDMEARIHQLFDDLNQDALRYQELYYTERKHIAFLDQQRCAGYSATAEAPADVIPPAA